MPAVEAFVGDVIVVRQERRFEPFQSHLVSAKFAEQRDTLLLLLGWLLLFHDSTPVSPEEKS
jgi:hypothetical protein